MYDICIRNYLIYCRSDIFRVFFFCGIKERISKFLELGIVYYCIVLVVLLDEFYWCDFLCFFFYKIGMYLIERVYWL